VKRHAAMVLEDLGKASVKHPPLLTYESGAESVTQAHNVHHREMLADAYKLMGEAYMDAKPPQYCKALAAFSKAVPGLPSFDMVLKGGQKSGKLVKSAACKMELTDEASAALIQVGTRLVARNSTSAHCPWN
jgi:hypothetical protein